MTQDERAFLDAIADNPEDDTARLVYADWLEEHSRFAAADAIRRGVERPKRFTFGEGKSALISYRGDRPDLKDVEVGLVGPYPGVSWTTYKGLVEYLSCSWANWLIWGNYLLGKAWVPEVVFTDVPGLVCQGRTHYNPDGSSYRYWAVPGRDWHSVGDRETPALVVLGAEWPRVRRWGWRMLLLPEEAARGPAVGEAVKCYGNAGGVLAAPPDEDGYAPVRPLPRG